MFTGSARLGRPSLGSWVTYGLGSENANLPGFVVLTSGGAAPDAGKSVWGNGFYHQFTRAFIVDQKVIRFFTCQIPKV